MNPKPILRLLHKSALAMLALVASAYGVAQTTTSVNLTSQRMNLQLPDGNLAPMWGFCTTPAAGGACPAGWAQGPQITVPAGNSLQITLTNNLPTFTSIVILGQIGEECGTAPLACSPTWMASPTHDPKTSATWPTNGSGSFTPPQQGMRMQSFVAEAAANGGTETYTWASTTLKPGTYLYETGSNPSIQAPMGLYGVVVVTTPPGTSAGQAYPGAFSSSDVAALNLANVPYDADAVMLISEIDLKQNTAVDALAAKAGVGGTIDPWAYPPVTNYAPTYFLMNGAPYNRASPTGITIANGPATNPTGRVLLRFANAGLQTHVPTVVGMNLSLFAEDGNVLPGMPKVQTEVLLPAGKTEDVAIYPTATTPGAFTSQTVGVYDRSLGLSAGNTPDSGIQAILQFGGASLPTKITPLAMNDTFTVPSDAITFSGNVLGNDTAIYNPKIIGPLTSGSGSVSFSSDGTGTFTYSSGLPAGSSFPGASFVYCGNGDISGTSALCATVTLTAGTTAIAPPTAKDVTFTRAISSYFQSSHPGALTNSSDPKGYTLTAQFAPGTPHTGVTLNPDGSFSVVGPLSSFQFVAVNSQGISSAPGTVTLLTPAGLSTGLNVTVVDALDYANKRALTSLTDYRWIIEEDTTYKNDAQFTGANGAAVPSSTLAVNFHKSYMPVVATGCYGTISCGGGQTWSTSLTPPANAIQPNVSVSPSDVYLDPAKHYFISILPGDAVNAFQSGTGNPGIDASGNPVPFNPATCTAGTTVGSCGHTMGGATIDPGQKKVQVLVEPNPLQTAQLSVFIFEDNNPTNGDIDGPEESLGLGGFQILVTDVGGRTGDPVGQMTYDAFNYPLTNALMGTYECPAVDANGALLPNTMAADYNAATGKGSVNGGHDTPPGRFLQGMIITCPSGTHPKDGTVNAGQPYALAGQALIKNLMPGRFDVSANPAASREQNGEKWYQVSTLEGTRGQDAFAKVGEPAYFQEFGPPGFHTFIGFVNPDHVNKGVNSTLTGTKYAVSGSIVNLHMSRPVAEGLFPGSHVPLSQTTCYVSLNENAGSGRNVSFAKCDQNGNFTLPSVPSGTYQLVAWDEWLDQIIAYKNVIVGTTDVATGPINVFSWFTRVETNTFLNNDGTHKPSASNDPVTQVPTTIRFRDGSISNVLKTDSSGNATFHELFPLFNWYVAESDQTRFAGVADSTRPNDPLNQGGVHVIVDGGGVPDVTGDYAGILTSTYPTGGTTEREYPNTQYLGLQGFVGQTEVINWEKREYRDATATAPAENGGITGTVVYSSTRPFDDPRLLFQNLWEPLVPRVTVNLYQETTAPDGSKGLTFVNSTKTSSWDDYVATDPTTGKTNMSCPGQKNDGSDPFVAYTLGSTNATKCYDGFHMWNQVQPAVYDGSYLFTTLADGITPLASGKYVVEMVTPPGYTLVKEEDKNILMGDAFIAPLYSQFGSLGNIFILPDQATVGQYNNNPNNPNNNNITTDLGHPTSNNFYPACVGTSHRVPDFMTLFPGSGQVAPFAGADRPLCDRKEVILTDKTQVNANFFVYTEAHIASHFTGMILDDAAAEINAASPDFGEKFAVPFVPVSIKDFNGIEISRLHADQWGTFNGLTPSSWQVNVPNPAGYSPNMLITCMNDPGPISDGKGGLITDPAYNPMFSNFCYTNPFMPGLTDYLDTPVLPVAAFAAGYNPVDCAYPVGNPAIKSVTTSFAGAFPAPFLTPAGGTVTITALGTVAVPNPAYAGPLATGSAPTVNRTYGFGTTKGTVTLGGVKVTQFIPSNGWTDGAITLNLPAGVAGGQLVVTNSAGISTTEAVTLTIEPTTATSPKYVSGKNNQKIQDAIDAAMPGDLILIDAGTYNELVIMDKPVRLQGIGANQVIINAAKYPTNKLANWRPRINADFGIDADGNQLLHPLVDPLPGQEITGGVILLEPSVLATEEGAGITVLAKNIKPTGGAIGSPACQIASTTAAAFNQMTAYNFACYPSRIDGISVTGGDAGGGIYVNGWAHNLEISNNKVYGNAGNFNGGIRVGIPYLEGLAGRGFDFDTNVQIHNNAITTNGTVEANAGASGAGSGISMCSGSDNYKVTNNYVCGNYSMSDGGGIGHIGVSMNGLIKGNKILFNQSYNQGTTVHGGGIVVEGESAAAGVTLGTGDLTIDSNLIQGNFAEAGSGGGIRLQDVNGAEGPNLLYKVTVTNNMIVNNVAGMAGGGISLANSPGAVIENNTIANNDSVGIAGPLFVAQPTTATPNPAGISTEPTGVELAAILVRNGKVTYPNGPQVLNNNIVWHNRSFFFDGTKTDPITKLPGLCSSNNVTDATGHVCNTLPAPTVTYPCPTTTSGGSAPSYWDLGVFGDTSATPGSNAGGIKLVPTKSILSDATNYANLLNPNISSDPLLVNSYCNGPRAMPGQIYEPGQPFLPPFTMAASMTLDEAGNFVDLRYGPLSTSYLATAAATQATPYGDYRITPNSPAVDAGSNLNAPPRDFFNTPRPQGLAVDIGAHELLPLLTLTPNTLSFGNVQIGQTSAVQTLNLANNGTLTATIVAINFGGVANGFAQTNNCAATVIPGASCTISVTYSPTAALGVGSFAATLQVRTVRETITASLTGTAVAQSATLTPNTLAFGSIQLGQTGTAQVATLRNAGVGPLTVGAINFGGAPNGFAQTNTCVSPLAAGASCSLSVTFRPTGTAGTRTATLSVTSGGVAQAVALSGTAVLPTGSFAPNPLAFGNLQNGQTSAPMTSTLTNSGAGPLSVTSVSFGGAADQFATTANTCTAALNPGATCTYTFTLSPTTAQAAAHNATFTVNFVGGGSTALSLTGTGTAATGTITAGPLSFTATRGTTSAAQTVTLTNTGNGPIPSVGSLTGTNPGQFAFTTTCGATLAAGSNCSFSLTFKPTGTSITGKTANLTVTGAPVNPVVLNGTPK